MKKIFLIFVLLSIYINAQTEKESVELPDFVIMGRQKIDVQTVPKSKPELIKIITEDFLLPRYSPEELKLLINANPEPVIPVIDDLNNSFFGNLYVGIGKYSYPVGELNLNKSLDNYLLYAKVWGTNIKEYVPSAGYNISGINVVNNIFISTKSKIFPGSKINVIGNYQRDSYKFYGSSFPDSLRITNSALFDFSFSNNYNRLFNSRIALKANFFGMKENNFREQLFYGSGYFEAKLKQFTLGGKINYQKQILENNLSGIDNNYYYTVEGFSKIYSIKNMVMRFGVTYSKTNIDYFVSPCASVEIKFYKNSIFHAEFFPQTEFLTIVNLKEKNLYMIPGFIDNVFLKTHINFQSSVKFVLDDQINIKLWGSYKTIKNYPYFEDRVYKGLFNVYLADKVYSYELGTNIYINTLHFGLVDCSFKLSQNKNENDNFIPYNPLYTFNFTYNYNFYFGLGFNLKYDLFKESYTDIKNSKSIPDYHNISFGIYYNMFNNLTLRADFHNILNKSNFVFDGYKEKLFDIILGIEYRWQ